MSNRYYTPVNFALEKNVVQLWAKVSFGADGVPTLDTANSKGVCAIHPETVNFTAWVTNSSTAVSSVSTLAGLYPGMTLGGTGLAVAGATISSIASGVITASAQSVTTTASGYSQAMTAAGGRYRFQFGSKEGVNLDAYNRLLNFSMEASETAASASGTKLLAALAPNATVAFLVDNKIATRTTTRSATAASTDCSLAFVLGDAAGTSFSIKDPKAGEIYRFNFVLSNSTAI
jgi:hypothetical protein